MKKLLFGTTALAAVGLIAGSANAADKIKMGVGGYFQAFLVYGDEDTGTGIFSSTTGLSTAVLPDTINHHLCE